MFITANATVYRKITTALMFWLIFVQQASLIWPTFGIRLPIQNLRNIYTAVIHHIHIN